MYDCKVLWHKCVSQYTLSGLESVDRSLSQQSAVLWHSMNKKSELFNFFINWTDTQANKGHWIRHTRKQRVWACSYQSSKPAHQLHHPSIFVPHCSLSLLKSVESCRPQSLQRWRKSGPKPRRPGLLSLQQPEKKWFWFIIFRKRRQIYLRGGIYRWDKQSS